MVELEMFKNPSLYQKPVDRIVNIYLPSPALSLLLPFYLENVIGLTPFYMGLVMAVDPIIMGIVCADSRLAFRQDRFGSKITMAGLVVMLVAYLLLSRLNENSSVWVIVGSLLFIGLGMGTFQSPNNSTIMGCAASNRLGVVSSILALSRSLGQTLGASVLGSLVGNPCAFGPPVQSRKEGAAGAHLILASGYAGFQKTYLYISALIVISIFLAGRELVRERQIA